MTDTIFKPLLENITANHLMGVYADAGYDIRFVGGCVRDCLSGVPIGDLDLATTATPEQGQDILKTANIKTIPTGIEHGTITALVDGVPFEITTLRRDVTSDGRRATVAYTGDWLEDAERRDFTINAMSLATDGTLYDPFEGQSDLKVGQVRFIGDAGKRIHEDALRILRFFRFNAHIGSGDMDEAGLEACVKNAKLLENLSKERIHQEVFKLLKGENIVPIWQVIVDHGVNEYFLKKSNNIKCLNSLSNVKHKNKPLLLSLFNPSDRDANTLQVSFKLSNKETRQIANALTAYNGEWDDLNATLYYHGAQAVSDAGCLRFGDGIIDQAQLESVLTIAQDWQKPEFPVTGDDLMAQGFTQGADLGVALKKLEKHWIKNDFKPTKQECLARV